MPLSFAVGCTSFAVGCTTTVLSATTTTTTTEAVVKDAVAATAAHSFHGDDNSGGGSAGSALWTTLAFAGCVLLLQWYDWQRRKSLKADLALAKARLNYLQEKLETIETTTSSSSTMAGKKRREIRIFMDGAFDLLHFGHMNAFRLARSLGTKLIVGVNSDVSITECKGAPLMNDVERLTMVKACKFVDDVVENCPYIMSADYLQWVIQTYDIDYVVHGDDPCIVDGKDVYESAKQSGKFRTIPRTQGVSTTDIVGRMLLLTKEHHYHKEQDDDRMGGGGAGGGSTRQMVSLGHQSKFLTTSQMLQLFSANVKAAGRDMRVIYIDGAWDMFHPGHVQTLQCARARGDYLIVGIHGDAVVNRERGMNLPLMNLHERVLSVLGCRYVSDVLIDAPYEITEGLLASLNVAEVVRVHYHYHHHHNDCNSISDEPREQRRNPATEDRRYRVAKTAGLFHEVHVESTFAIKDVVARIQRNQEAFQARFERKKRAEDDYTVSKSLLQQ